MTSRAALSASTCETPARQQSKPCSLRMPLRRPHGKRPESDERSGNGELIKDGNETMKHLSLGLVLVAAVCACSRDAATPASTTGPANQGAAAPAGAAPADRPAPSNPPISRVADDPLPPATSPYDSLPEGLAKSLDVTFTGDFDEMVKRRVIRVGTVFNRTHYFVDRGQERGLAYEGFKRFEDDLNAQLKSGLLKVHVVMVRSHAISSLRRCRPAKWTSWRQRSRSRRNG
jgi:hypothetical protein